MPTVRTLDSQDLDSPPTDLVQETADVLRNGGLVIYPTETCYGLGCDALNTTAVKKLYRAKERPVEKKLTVIVSRLEMAETYCHLSPVEKKICRALMPGALTWIAEKKPNIPDLLNTSFAFRIPDSPLCRNIAEELKKPVVATSANISGQPSSYAVDQIDKELVDRADLVLDAGQLHETPSSTVATLKAGNLKIYRQGPVKQEDIERAING